MGILLDSYNKKNTTKTNIKSGSLVDSYNSKYGDNGTVKKSSATARDVLTPGNRYASLSAPKAPQVVESQPIQQPTRSARDILTKNPLTQNVRVISPTTSTIETPKPPMSDYADNVSFTGAVKQITDSGVYRGLSQRIRDSKIGDATEYIGKEIGLNLIGSILGGVYGVGKSVVDRKGGSPKNIADIKNNIKTSFDEGVKYSKTGGDITSAITRSILAIPADLIQDSAEITHVINEGERGNPNEALNYIARKTKEAIPDMTDEQAWNYTITGKLGLEGETDEIDKLELVKVWTAALIHAGLTAWQASAIGASSLNKFYANNPTKGWKPISTTEFRDGIVKTVDAYGAGEAYSAKLVGKEGVINVSTPTFGRRLSEPVLNLGKDIRNVQINSRDLPNKLGVNERGLQAPDLRPVVVQPYPSVANSNYAAAPSMLGTQIPALLNRGVRAPENSSTMRLPAPGKPNIPQSGNPIEMPAAPIRLPAKESVIDSIRRTAEKNNKEFIPTNDTNKSAEAWIQHDQLTWEPMDKILNLTEFTKNGKIDSAAIVDWHNSGTNKAKDAIINLYKTNEGGDVLSSVIKTIPKTGDGKIIAYRIGDINNGVQSYTINKNIAESFAKYGVNDGRGGFVGRSLNEERVKNMPGSTRGLPINKVMVEPNNIVAWNPNDWEILVESSASNTKIVNTISETPAYRNAVINENARQPTAPVKTESVENKLQEELNDISAKITDKVKLQNNLDNNKTLANKVLAAKAQLNLETVKAGNDNIATETRKLTSKEKETAVLKQELKTAKESGKSQSFFEELYDKHQRDFINDKSSWDKSEVVSDFIDENYYKKAKDAYFAKASKGLGSAEKRGVPTGNEKLNIAEWSYRYITKYAKKVSEKYTPRGSAGAAFKSDNVAVKSLNDVPTVVHETTHVIDNGAEIIERVITKAGEYPDIVKELEEIYLKTYPGAKKHHLQRTKLKEGFAMFIQNMATNPTATKAEYPALYKGFLSENAPFGEPMINEMLNDADKVITQWQQLSDIDKIKSTMVGDVIEKDNKSAFSAWDKIQTEVFDYIWPSEKVSELAGVAFTEKDPTIFLRQYSRVASVINNNLTPKDGFWTLNNKGELIKKHDYNWGDFPALLMKKGDYYDYGAYLKARRTHFDYKYLEQLNKDIKNIDEVIKSTDDAIEIRELKAEKKLLEEDRDKIDGVLQNQKLDKDVADRVYVAEKERFSEYDKMYDNLVRADLDVMHNPMVRFVNNEKYNKYTKNPGYAPLMKARLDEFGGDDFRGSSVKSTKISSTKTRRGSEKQDIHPVESSIKIHAETMKKALLQINYNLLYDIKDVADGQIFQVVPLEINASATGVEYPQYRDPNIIMAIDKNYELRPMIVDPQLKKVYDVLFDTTATHLVMKLLKNAARLFTKTTTGLYLPFVLPNIAVDSLSMTAQTRNATIPVLDAIKQTYEGLLKKDPETAMYFKEYFVLGGAENTFVGMLNGEQGQIVIKLTEEKNKILKVADNIGDWMAIPTQYSELLSRVPEYINARKAGKHQYVAMEQSSLVTTAFAHHGRMGGKLGRDIIRSIPYSNVPYQVLHTIIKTIKNPETRKRAMLMVLALTAAGVAGTVSLHEAIKKAHNDGDKEKEEALINIRNQKNNQSTYGLNNYLYLTNQHGLHKIKVPSVYNITSAIAQMALAEYYGDTDYSTNEYLNAALESNMPSQINPMHPKKAIFASTPAFIKNQMLPILGYTDFPEVRPVETFYDQLKAPSERYGENTNDLAVILGKATNQSPKRIETWLQTNFGRLFTDVTDEITASRKEYLKSIFIEPYQNQILQKDTLFVGREYQKFYDDNKQTSYDYAKDKLKYGKQNDAYENVADLLSKMRKVEGAGILITNADKNKVHEVIQAINKGKYEDVNTMIYKLNISDLGGKIIQGLISHELDKIKQTP